LSSYFRKEITGVQDFLWRDGSSLFTVAYEPRQERAYVMEDLRISADELKAALAGDMDAFFVEVAEAMNTAKRGRIIADSEEPVRDAHAEFRQRAFQKAVELLQARQESFSPSARRAEEQGPAEDLAPDDQQAD
jgi:hypothetical protein